MELKLPEGHAEVARVELMGCEILLSRSVGVSSLTVQLSYAEKYHHFQYHLGPYDSPETAVLNIGIIAGEIVKAHLAVEGCKGYAH